MTLGILSKICLAIEKCHALAADGATASTTRKHMRHRLRDPEREKVKTLAGRNTTRSMLQQVATRDLSNGLQGFCKADNP